MALIFRRSILIVLMLAYEVSRRGAVASTPSSSPPTSLASNALPSSCLLRCKDAHMVQMENEWSMDFAFPLLSLMRANVSERLINERLANICEQNLELEECLNRCPPSDEQQILFIGLEPWREVCSNMKVLQTQLPCWKLNVNVLTMNCYMESHKLRGSIQALTRNFSTNGLATMCRYLNALSVCSILEYGKYCGMTTKRLISNLFRISRESMMKMLKMKRKNVPAKCLQDWRTFEIDYSRDSSASSHKFPFISMIFLTFLEINFLIKI